jgi:hypothetical protein
MRVFSYEGRRRPTHNSRQLGEEAAVVQRALALVYVV